MLKCSTSFGVDCMFLAEGFMFFAEGCMFYIEEHTIFLDKDS